jgi:phosphoenolpyruvate carboxylase
VARAFTHFLALSNSAENHHRVRRLRHRMMSTECALSPKEDSCSGTVRRLLGAMGKSKEEVYEALCQQKVEIVLTAHPTEVNRRTMLQKHQRIREILQAFDRVDLTPHEVRNLHRQLHIEISSIWETDELRRSNPTPVEEARGGLNIVQDVLWFSVPSFLRKLDDMSRMELGRSLPLDMAPIRLASWMGGDRDGNPNVTPQITKEVTTKSRETAALLFLHDIRLLKGELSMKRATAEVKALAGAGAVEPYRAVLDRLQHRLEATLRWTRNEPPKPGEDALIFTTTAELMEPLRLLHSSLVATGRAEIADGP